MGGPDIEPAADVWATAERRSIPLSRRGHLIGSVPIGTSLVGFESSLERDFVYLSAAEPGFISISSQPVTLAFRVDRKMRRYTPDYLVRRSKFPPELVEIKFHSDLVKQANALAASFDAARRWCAARGWSFTIRTEIDVRGPRLENAKRLARFRSFRFCAARRDEVLNRIKEPIAIGQLGLEPDLLPTFWALMAQGFIDFPVHEPITRLTVVVRA